jgi:hypothetical protein
LSDQIIRVLFKVLKFLNEFLGIVKNPGHHISLQSDLIKTVVEKSYVKELINNVLSETTCVLFA